MLELRAKIPFENQELDTICLIHNKRSLDYSSVGQLWVFFFHNCQIGFFLGKKIQRQLSYRYQYQKKIGCWLNYQYFASNNYLIMQKGRLSNYQFISTDYLTNYYLVIRTLTKLKLLLWFLFFWFSIIKYEIF
jgi:hypothetical protein